MSSHVLSHSHTTPAPWVLQLQRLNPPLLRGWQVPVVPRRRTLPALPPSGTTRTRAGVSHGRPLRGPPPRRFLLNPCLTSVKRLRNMSRREPLPPVVEEAVGQLGTKWWTSQGLRTSSNNTANSSKATSAKALCNGLDPYHRPKMVTTCLPEEPLTTSSNGPFSSALLFAHTQNRSMSSNNNRAEASVRLPLGWSHLPVALPFRILGAALSKEGAGTEATIATALFAPRRRTHSAPSNTMSSSWHRDMKHPEMWRQR